MNKISTSLLIVGAGPAGLAAAAEASKYVEVAIVDDNPYPGGQIWRAAKGKLGSRTARRLVGEIENSKIKFISGAQVFEAAADNSLRVETRDGSIEIVFRKLIIATGAARAFSSFSRVDTARSLWGRWAAGSR